MQELAGALKPVSTLLGIHTWQPHLSPACVLADETSRKKELAPSWLPNVFKITTLMFPGLLGDTVVLAYYLLVLPNGVGHLQCRDCLLLWTLALTSPWSSLACLEACLIVNVYTNGKCQCLICKGSPDCKDPKGNI